MTERGRLDLVVVGGGPAGLAAADAASTLGANVLLLDDGASVGGQVWRHRVGDHLPIVAERLIGAVQPPRVAVAKRAMVIDAHDSNSLIVSFNGRVAVVETSAIVIATGATERFLPFPGWTLPGVVGIGGLQALVKSGLRVDGSRIVIAGAGPLSLPVAASLTRAGAHVRLIAEQASKSAVRKFAMNLIRDPAKIRQATLLRLATWRSRYCADSWPLKAIANEDESVDSVVMRVAGKESIIECDWLATSAGLVPRTEVGQLLGCSIAGNAIEVDELQCTSVPNVFAVGECTGIKGDYGARIEGMIAGRAAVGETDIPVSLLRTRDRSRAFGELLELCFAPRPELAERVEADTTICRCESVTRSDLQPEWSQRQAKLWTRIGMGACQGAVCGPACQTLFGWEGNSTRPPLDQPELGAWARGLSALDRE